MSQLPAPTRTLRAGLAIAYADAQPDPLAEAVRRAAGALMERLGGARMTRGSTWP